jgi:HNH endonuclease.
VRNQEGVRSVPQDAYYSGAKHRKWREAVLRRAGYLCEECRRYGRMDEKGLPVAATTAHHIKHRDEYPELQYIISNGRALCEKCHNKAHPEKGKTGRKW